MKKVKPKKCKYSKCDKFFIPFRSTQQTCFNLNCAKGYNIESSKVESSINSFVEKKIEQYKINLKTLSEYEADARKPFQLFIRTRDKDLPCISCGTYHSKIWDAGHFFKAELYSGLIFTEENVHKQCRRCNKYLNGNELAYREGLVKRYGEEYVLALEKIKDANRVRKWTRDEYITIKVKYKLLNKNLKK